MATAALGLSSYSLYNMLNLNDDIQYKIHENIVIEDLLLDSIKSITQSAQCKIIPSDVLFQDFYFCTSSKPLGFKHMLVNDKRVMAGITRYFKTSKQMTLVKAGFIADQVNLDFIKYEDEQFTFTVTSKDNGWKITCVKPRSSGEVCPKS